MAARAMIRTVEAMKIDPFDESLDHRRILPYDPVYSEIFADLQGYVREKLAGVELVHIGSTAIPDLRGKPMVDVVAVTHRGDLRAVQKEFEELGFQRRAVWVDRDDKPYVCASVKHDGRRFNINIHICHPKARVHVDSVVFAAILAQRPDLRRTYEEAKDRAHSVDPANPEIYNRAKQTVIAAIHDEIEKSRSNG